LDRGCCATGVTTTKQKSQLSFAADGLARSARESFSFFIILVGFLALGLELFALLLFILMMVDPK